MKKCFIAVLVLLSAFMLSAASKKVDFVWKAEGRSFPDFKTYAFGFGEERDEYCFAFQIKSLKQLMEQPDSMLVVCVNTDNNKKTGRFKDKGWDLQLNILLNRRTVSAIVWEDNKIQTSHSFGKGEFSIEAEEDILYVTIKKVVYLKNIKFGKNIILFEEHTNGKKPAASGIENGVNVTLK